MIKENSAWLILFILTLTGFHSTAQISGRLDDVDKKDLKIYLVEPGTFREVAASYLGKVIDSTIINKDGSFAFRNPPDTKDTVLLELAVQASGRAANYLQTDDPINSNYIPIVWHLGESVEITASFNQFQKIFSIEHPSEINKALLELRDVNRKAYETYLAGKHWQVEDGSQLLEKEDAVMQYRLQLIKFADSTQYLLPAMVATRWVSPENNYERVPEFLVRQCNKWKKKQPGHPWVEQLCKESTSPELPVLTGDVFPDFRFPMITKDTLSLKEMLGTKLTIIDLWASWCAPCRKENRDVLLPIWNEYHNDGLQVIAYALESEVTSWEKAAELDGANHWYQASDLKGDDAPLLKKIRVQTIPSNFILDDKGVVMAKNIHGKALVDWVKNYMEKK